MILLTQLALQEIEMNTTHPPTARAGFGLMLSLAAMAMPLLLVLYAFATQDNTVARAHIIVHGCEGIVGAFAAALVLRAVYILGAWKGSALMPRLPVRAIEMA
jgi:hypothetical protein